MLSLTPEEKEWVDEYKQILNEKYPGLIEDIIIFGSKARGDAHADSDIDMLVRIKEGDRHLKKDIRLTHFEKTLGRDILPMIIVCTNDDWEFWKSNVTSFVSNIVHDGVSIQ